MLCRVTQDGWVTVESSDKMRSTVSGNGKPLQYSCYDNAMNIENQKGKNILHQKMSPPDQKVTSMLLGKSRGQLLIAPERMKPLGQSRNITHLWMSLLMRVKSRAVQNIIV